MTLRPTVDPAKQPWDRDLPDSARKGQGYPTSDILVVTLRIDY